MNTFRTRTRAPHGVRHFKLAKLASENSSFKCGSLLRPLAWPLPCSSWALLSPAGAGARRIAHGAQASKLDMSPNVPLVNAQHVCTRTAWQREQRHGKGGQGAKEVRSAICVDNLAATAPP